MSPRRQVQRFDLDAVREPEELHRVLNEYASEVAERIDALNAATRVAVLDDLFVTIPGTYAVASSPFPVQVQTPFSITGATCILSECMEGATAQAGIGTTPVIPWVRPVSGGTDGEGTAMEIVYVTGLAINRTYRLRLAVFGVIDG
jgi:hypothetical protein